MNQSAAPVEKARELLSKCVGQFHTYAAANDDGQYDEEDLARLAERLRKVVKTLVPSDRQGLYLKEIDDGLFVSEDVRVLEKELVHVIPGPFIASRAKRLAYVAEGLRDDFDLGKLVDAAHKVERPVSPVTRTAPIGEEAGDLPEPLKWLVWIRANWRAHPWLTFMIVVIIAVSGATGLAGLYPTIRDAIAPKRFVMAGSDDLDPHSDTCLDAPTQIVPARTAVCATMHGSWKDGRGPLGLGNHGAMTIWSKEATWPHAVLVSPHAYQHSDWFQGAVDYVICVRPPQGAERTDNIADRMNIDVTPKPHSGCQPVKVRP
jgi:hypothetical protein